MKLPFKFLIIFFLNLIFLGCSNKSKYKLMYNKLHFLEKEQIANMIERDENLKERLGYSQDRFWDKYTDISSMYLSIGNAYFTLGENAKAIMYYKRHLKLDKSIMQGYINTNIADLYIQLGLYDKARDYLNVNLNSKTLFFNKKRVLELFAEIAIKEEKFEKAIFYAKKILKIPKVAPIFVAICKEHNKLGDLYILTKDYSKAIEHFSYSLKLAESQLSNKNSEYNMYKKRYHNPEVYSVASMEYLLSHPTVHDARTSEEFSVGASKYPYPYREISLAYYYLGKVYYKLGKYKKAHLNFKNSYKYKTDATYHKKYLNEIYRYFALIELKIKNYKKFTTLFEYYLIQQKTLYGNAHPAVAKSYQKLANIVFREKKDYQKSFKYNQVAFNILKKNRKNNSLILNRLEKRKNFKFMKKNINNLLNSAFLYKTNVEIVAQRTINKQIINSWLNYKGIILDSENSISTIYAKTKDKVLKEKIDKLKLYQRISAKLYQNIEKDRDTWQRKIEKVETKMKNLTNEIFQKEQGLKSIDYKDITKNLKNSELYIDYAKAGDYYYIFTLDKQENIEFIQIDENRTKEIDALVMSFRDEVQSIIDDKIINKTKLKKLTQSSKEKLARLYALLIKNPLRGQLKSKSSLIFSPDGALRLFPFETLYDEEKQEYLIESKEIRYIPSGKELVRLYKYAKNRVPTKENVMVFANPNFDSNETAPYHESIALTRGTNENIIKPFFQKIYEPLRGTKLEADAIKETIENVEVFEWNRANETNLLNVQEPKILHIATHGFFINAPNIPNPMLKSGIILSGANKSAREKQGYGRITALKLSGLNLKNTDLVVLSACDTGVVDINNTDSISGLGKAFIQAGAKDVLMSLWSVDDNATKELMVSFYKQIKENPNYALALKEAKLKMIAEDMHPFYWGGFVVLGL